MGQAKVRGRGFGRRLQGGWDRLKLGVWLWTAIAGRVGQAKVRGRGFGRRLQGGWDRLKLGGVALDGDCREGGTG